MSIGAIKELINEFKDGDLTKLKVKCQDFELTLEREKEKVLGGMPTSGAYNASAIIAPVPSVPAKEEALQIEEKKSNEGPVILSPMVGTFYASSAPGKPPFVTVGTKVKKGDVVCIIEAMKLMNEVEAEVDGEIAEVLVQNEEMVEFAQPLFRLK